MINPNTSIVCALRARRSFATTAHVSRPSNSPRTRLTGSSDDKLGNLQDDKHQVDLSDAPQTLATRSTENDVAHKTATPQSPRRSSQNASTELPLLRGMPVFDATFNAIRSGTKLMFNLPVIERSVQYLLPLAHSIVEQGPRVLARGPSSNASCTSPSHLPNFAGGEARGTDGYSSLSGRHRWDRDRDHDRFHGRETGRIKGPKLQHPHNHAWEPARVDIARTRHAIPTTTSVAWPDDCPGWRGKCHVGQYPIPRAASCNQGPGVRRISGPGRVETGHIRRV
jgi:hypothetical protein